MPPLYWFLVKLVVLIVVGGGCGYVFYRLVVWLNCRQVKRQLDVEVATNGHHVRTLNSMLDATPHDSGIFQKSGD